MQTPLKLIVKIIGAIILLVLCIGVLLLGIFLYQYRKEIDLLSTIQRQDEITYLVLFQNTLELRPTGGFIGNFAEVTLNKGKVKEYTIYNTNVFDYGKPGIDSPQPFKDMLGVNQIQLRDGNWSPDFPTAAQQIIELYRLEGGLQEIDGIIAINALVLPEVLKIIGPVYLESMNKTLNADEVLLALQYELNFGFIEKGIDRSDRKEPIRDLATVIENSIKESSPLTLYRLGSMVLEQARQKQVLIWSQDRTIQDKVVALNWTGAIDTNTEGDYFMLVDANLGSLKTDYYMKRDIAKTVDECGDKVCSRIIITYYNTATSASPLNNDYQSYTRVLLPQDAFINSISGIEKRPVEIDYFSAYNKKVAGFEINVPFNGKREIIIEYTIPKLAQYNFTMQKQSGIEGYNLTLQYTPNNKQKSLFINKDWAWKN